MPFLVSVEGAFGYGRPIPPATAVVEFNYPNFSSTAGLSLVSVFGVVSNQLYITNTSGNDVGNVYRSTTLAYNRSFSFEWNFECFGGNGADGFCLQWTPTNNTNGNIGGGVGYLTTSVQSFTFLTWTNNVLAWYKNNINTNSLNVTNGTFRQNLYYWADYNHSASTMNIYWSTVYIKPATPNFTCTGFSFGTTPYYIGFGAATGGATDNHVLKSMKLTFT